MERITGAQMTEIWTLEMGEKTVLIMPRLVVLRTMIFDHIIHHRAQLTAYLRLNGAPVPALYGPSADERAF